ncbi:HNH endonuclease [Streptomyces sp. S6]
MSRGHALNSAMRRTRRMQLLRRDGRCCAYCRRPFPDLREATFDHVVPQSLWRSWSVGSLVLACVDCNRAKADRFPLSIALLILGWADPAGPVVRPVDLPVLARLAHANRPVFEAVWTPDPIGQGSTPDLRDDPRHTRRHSAPRVARPVCGPVDRRGSIRPACLRSAGRSVRACAGPAGEAVYA